MRKEQHRFLKMNKPITLISVMIIIDMLVISFCTSYSKFYFTYNKDRNCGFLHNQRTISISNDDQGINVDKVLSICKEKDNIEQIIISGFLYNKIDENNKKDWMIPVVLTKINSKSIWNPIISSGNFFTKQDSDFQENSAVVGNSLLKNKLSNAENVQIYDESFKVIGIAGNDSYNSDYNSAIFLPIDKLPKGLKNNVKTMNIRIYSNKKLDEKASELEASLKYNPQITIQEERNNNYLNFYKYSLKSIAVSIAATILLLINVLIILYYNKTKLKKYIFECDIRQLLIQCVSFVILTLIIHKCIYSILKISKINELYLDLYKVTYINIIQCFITYIIIYIVIRQASKKVFAFK